MIGAGKTGVGVPAGDFDAIVHSVFERACILRLTGGALVTMVPEQAGGLPGAITLDGDGPFDGRQSIATGIAAGARGGILRIAGTDIAVDLRGAVPWRSELAGIAADLSEDAQHAAWHVAGDALARDGRAAALQRIAAEPIAALDAAGRRLSADAAGGAVVGLIGLGHGGTPAGDDFLVGFFGGLWASAGRDARRLSFVSDAAARLRAGAHRTNDVSRVYLEAAAGGEVSEKLTLLIGAIARGASAAEVRAVAAACIAVGHTSGADGTLGVLTGLGVWAPAGAIPGAT